MSYTEIVAERGNFRASIVVDENPHEPEFFAGDPIFDLSDDGALRYGGQTDDYPAKVHPAVAAVQDAIQSKVIADRYSYCGEWDHETFERYVRIFHGGSVEWISGGYREGTRYAAVALPEFRKAHGCSDAHLNDPAEHTEWSAYIEGDVYGVVIEERVHTFTEVTRADGGLVRHEDSDDWDEVQAVWGYYGTEYAEESARLELDNFASPEVAA
jgi:hypothetical protein